MDEIIDTRSKVVAFIVRDAKNRAYVKMGYDFGEGLKDAFELNREEARRASHIFHKCSFAGLGNDDRDLVKTNPDTGAIYSERDFNYLNTPSYVTGSEPGQDACLKTIEAISFACSNRDVMIPFYVCSGSNQIYYNEHLLARTINPDEAFDRDKERDLQLSLLQMLSGEKPPEAEMDNFDEIR